MMEAALQSGEVLVAIINRRYYQLLLGNLQPLPKPILSRRLRRITFIPTTRKKFKTAIEINDLWDESPLEDRCGIIPTIHWGHSNSACSIWRTSKWN